MTQLVEAVALSGHVRACNHLNIYHVLAAFPDHEESSREKAQHALVGHSIHSLHLFCCQVDFAIEECTAPTTDIVWDQTLQLFRIEDGQKALRTPEHEEGGPKCRDLADVVRVVCDIDLRRVSQLHTDSVSSLETRFGETYQSLQLRL